MREPYKGRIARRAREWREQWSTSSHRLGRVLESTWDELEASYRDGLLAERDAALAEVEVMLRIKAAAREFNGSYRAAEVMLEAANAVRGRRAELRETKGGG